MHPRQKCWHLLRDGLPNFVPIRFVVRIGDVEVDLHCVRSDIKVKATIATAAIWCSSVIAEAQQLTLQQSSPQQSNPQQLTCWVRS